MADLIPRDYQQRLVFGIRRTPTFTAPVRSASASDARIRSVLDAVDRGEPIDVAIGRWFAAHFRQELIPRREAKASQREHIRAAYACLSHLPVRQRLPALKREASMAIAAARRTLVSVLPSKVERNSDVVGSAYHALPCKQCSAPWWSATDGLDNQCMYIESDAKGMFGLA